jgi:hypothetical protein
MAQSLIEKLRIKPRNRIAVLNLPEAYAGYPPKLPKEVAVLNSLQGSFDQVHLFVVSKAELDSLAPAAMKALNPGGLLWVCFPKKTTGAQTDLSRDRGWDTLGKAGLSAISLISLDKTWSAFAFRKRPSRAATESRPGNAGENTDTKYVDRTKRIVRAPEDLERALRNNRTLAAKFDALAWTHQKEYVEWVLAAKRDETRAKRVRGTIERLRKELKNPSHTR